MTWEWLRARALWLLGGLAAILPVVGYLVGRSHGATAERARTAATSARAVDATLVEDAQRTIDSVARERQAEAEHAAIDEESARREAITRPTVADALAEHERAERLRRGGA